MQTGWREAVSANGSVKSGSALKLMKEAADIGFENIGLASLVGHTYGM